jgi:hypothetical protein
MYSAMSLLRPYATPSDMTILPLAVRGYNLIASTNADWTSSGHSSLSSSSGSHADAAGASLSLSAAAAAASSSSSSSAAAAAAAAAAAREYFEGFCFSAAPPVFFERDFLGFTKGTLCALFLPSLCCCHSLVNATAAAAAAAGGSALASHLPLDTGSLLIAGVDGRRLSAGAGRLAGELEVHFAHVNLVPHLTFLREHLA